MADLLIPGNITGTHHIHYTTFHGLFNPQIYKKKLGEYKKTGFLIKTLLLPYLTSLLGKSPVISVGRLSVGWPVCLFGKAQITVFKKGKKVSASRYARDIIKPRQRYFNASMYSESLRVYGITFI